MERVIVLVLVPVGFLSVIIWRKQFAEKIHQNRLENARALGRMADALDRRRGRTTTRVRGEIGDSRRVHEIVLAVFASVALVVLTVAYVISWTQ